MKSVTSTLLIDDDKFTSFYNEKIVKKHNKFGEIISLNSGKAALEYLEEAIAGKALKPDVIFLDINMPAMNGWEFIEAYKELDAKFTDDIKIIMLTTSSNPKDKERSQTLNEITDYINKPLSLSILDNIIEDLIPCKTS
ncbi:response regulator [Tamlana sp. 2_MG-2023]|uniref:response regulator n=1 Tax=unclassified Tamlana TaxID=2614803 RepID=UPI0026E48DAA|nr:MULTISPECIES: response regulator [unclassified Tamlana]MDO6759854.1 response regulator [Tamlana sp. 2_MG-2023]MDO6791976.1 response regulator [Tamlana sp. 1_MG-2023]